VLARGVLAGLAGLLAAAEAPAAAPQVEDEPVESVPVERGAAGEPAPGAPRERRLDWGFEVKAHYRDSEANRFPVPFPFAPDQLPPGVSQGFMSTVDPGAHGEISTATLFLDAAWGASLAGRLKVDLIDLYDRNPTSTDREVDVDEAWVRFGRESEPAELPERPGAYLKVGKMPKFERQDDRHLESYGLVSTAFNRFEDLGIELGVDLGRFVYLKATATQGNPVFLRDPNALAGDNGTPELERPNPRPRLGTGVVILYDAEIEGVDLGGDLELGGGLGVRWANAAGDGVDLLVWGSERELADTVDFHGTFYGGDLDLLLGPGNAFPFPLDGRDKREVGANLWLYRGGLSVFLQAVDQDLAGLERLGLEAEVAWRLELPLVWAVGGRQLFPSIAPAVRWSRLEPDFAPPAVTPSPSFAWEWEKVDVGVRLTLVRGVDLTAEYAAHEFIRAAGPADNDELLVTLRWRR
jgi:hypothetical protein